MSVTTIIEPCKCSEHWKKKYYIVEKILIKRYSWSHGAEWAKRLIRQDVKEHLRNDSKQS